VDALFKGLDNGIGLILIQPDIKARLRRALLAPTRENWLDAYGIVLRRRALHGAWLTMLEAVIAVDPTFPHTQPDWTTRVPDQLLIARALRGAQRQAPIRPDTDWTRAHG
jgi:hypothetical protein